MISPYVCQLIALIECLLLNCTDSGRDHNMLKRFASTECLLPNLLQPISKIYSNQLRAMIECLGLIALTKKSLNAASLIALTAGGITMR